MNKEENNFEEFLRAKLENHTVEVNDSVWAGIEKKQKKREKFIWFRQYLNVFLALDIVFILGFAALSILSANDVQSKNKIKSLAKIQPETPAIVASSSEEATASNPAPEPYMEQNIPDNITKENNENNIKKITNRNKTLTSNTSTTIDNTGMLSSKSIVPNKITEKQKEKAAFTLENLPVHNELSNDKEVTNTAIYASIQPLALHPLSKTNQYDFSINESKEDFTYLPPSVSQSKPKKVLKAEQKAIAQTNKALAKQAQEQEKAIANKQTEQAEKATDETKIEESATVTNENEMAPLALDTVYGKKKFKGYLAFDALISPELAGRTFNGSTQQVQDYISRRDSAEKMRISYSALMRINLFINRNIFINTGISFSQRKEKFSIEHKWQTHEDYIDSSKFITIIDPFEGSIIYKTYDTLDYVRTQKETLNHNLTMTFIDVPAMIGYKWLGKRAGIALQGGVIFNLLFKQKGTMADFNYTANDVTTATQNPFNTTAGLSVAGGITSNYRLTEKLDLLVEPHTRYVLKPINNSAYPLQQKLFIYGLNVGLRLKL